VRTECACGCSDGSGSIPTDELVGIIQNNGKRMRQEEIDDFRAECDPSNSGRCNYQQFIQILTGPSLEFGIFT
jgi:Ca2+-binding EF-hand superfamily protein